MLLVRLDGPEGEMLGVVTLDGLPAEIGALRARLDEIEAEELAFRGASISMVRAEVFDGEGAVVLRTCDDVLFHVAERGFYLTGRLDAEPVRTWDVPWRVVE